MRAAASKTPSNPAHFIFLILRSSSLSHRSLSISRALTNRLLLDTWELSQPDVIISVTGAADDSGIELNDEQRDVFKQGLLNAVRMTNAWVITGGTNSGVMGLVGKTMAEQRTSETGVCLGIVTWGIVKNHEDLETRTGRIHKYDSADTPAGGFASKFSDASRRSPGLNHPRSSVKKERIKPHIRAPIDPYHSHFIFVDAGPDKAGEFGHEIDLRTKLEASLTQGVRTDDDGEADEPTSPKSVGLSREASSAAEVAEAGTHGVMICVVVGGGPGTYKMIHNLLLEERPVAILAHSGGAATDIYEYVTNDITPQNEVKHDGSETGGKAYVNRQRGVDAAPEFLPVIKKKGLEKFGLYHVPLLTFFGEEDLKARQTGGVRSGEREVKSGAIEQNFDQFLLRSILSKVPQPVDALMHAVSWGDASIVRKQLQEMVDFMMDPKVHYYWRRRRLEHAHHPLCPVLCSHRLLCLPNRSILRWIRTL